MKIIDFDTIYKLDIDPLKCYKWVSDAILYKNKAQLPAKISLKPEIANVFYNTMPVIIPFTGTGGVKVVTRYPERKPTLDSKILLYDLKTGENIAYMDGNWITTMRTGAVAAHSIKLLAVKDFRVIGIIGLGNTARASLKVLLAIYPEKKLIVKLKKYKDQHLLFKEYFSSEKNIVFEECENYEETVRNCDVVISAVTVFENDICDDSCFKEGCTIVPVHTKGFSNCDLFFDKVYADDVNHVKNFRYFNKFKSFSEISNVVNHNFPGRINNHERIIVYNIGIALHDIYFASKIYEMCCNRISSISMHEPKDKFWI